MAEHRRILLDGYPTITTRRGDALVADDGRSVAIDEAAASRGRSSRARQRVPLTPKSRPYHPSASRTAARLLIQRRF